MCGRPGDKTSLKHSVICLISVSVKACQFLDKHHFARGEAFNLALESF